VPPFSWPRLCAEAFRYGGPVTEYHPRASRLKTQPCVRLGYLCKASARNHQRTNRFFELARVRPRPAHPVRIRGPQQKALPM